MNSIFCMDFALKIILEGPKDLVMQSMKLLLNFKHCIKMLYIYAYQYIKTVYKIIIIASISTVVNLLHHLQNKTNQLTYNLLLKQNSFFRH